jgi:hypothetical protein
MTWFSSLDTGDKFLTVGVVLSAIVVVGIIALVVAAVDSSRQERRDRADIKRLTAPVAPAAVPVKAPSPFSPPQRIQLATTVEATWPKQKAEAVK